eukprot:1822757-Pyramimonas_sp.AAC.1
MVKLSWRMTLPPRQCAGLEEALESGDLKIPQRSLLTSSCVKFDIAYSMFQRRVIDRVHGWRGGRILFPLGVSAESVAQVDLQ